MLFPIFSTKSCEREGKIGEDLERGKRNRKGEVPTRTIKSSFARQQRQEKKEKN